MGGDAKVFRKGFEGWEAFARHRVGRAKPKQNLVCPKISYLIR